MSHCAVYRALGVEGHVHRSIQVCDGRMLIRLTMEGQEVCCPGYHSQDVIRRGIETREFKAPPIGDQPVVVLVGVIALPVGVYRLSTEWSRLLMDSDRTRTHFGEVTISGQSLTRIEMLATDGDRTSIWIDGSRGPS